MANDPQWLVWSKRLQAIAQNGLTFARDPFDLERYAAILNIAAELAANGAGVDVATVKGVFEQQSGYTTPKVDMRGVVFRDDSLLLVRERTDGLWSLPGGWADPGESPAENVVREIREESGFETRAKKILAIYDRSKHPHHPPHAFHVYKVFMLCELVGGVATTSKETDAVEFFAENALPELSIGRVTAGQIRRMFEHLRNPAWPPDFDGSAAME